MAKNYKKKAKKKAVKYAKSHKKLVIIGALILIVAIVAVVLIIKFAKPDLWDSIFNGGKDEQQQSSGVNIPEGDLTEISSSDLSIHFLELGDDNIGDCSLIKVGNTEVLIDAGAKAGTAPTKEMLDYIDTYCTDGVLEYVIVTHAHEDHYAGMIGTNKSGILYKYEVGTLITFARTNQSSTNDKGNKTLYGQFEDARDYAIGRGAKWYTALECWNESKEGAKKTYYLDAQQTISMNILYQKYYEQEHNKENNYSVCTLFTQSAGNNTYNYIFTGDLEGVGENSLAESNNLPHCVLYKGGHHGSSTSSTTKFMDKITPENIAICTCAGTYEYAAKPNAQYPDRYLNTFPTQEAIERMAKYTDKIYVTTLGIINESYETTGFTSMNGNIVFYYGNKEGETQKSLKLWCSNNTTPLKDTEWFANNRKKPSYWT